MNKPVRTTLFLMLAAAVTALPALAQPPGGPMGPGPMGPGPMGPGGPGMFDPAQMQQRMMEMQKMMLGATDEEWVVVEPLLQGVMEAQRNTRFTGPGMMGMGMMGPGGPGGPGMGMGMMGPGGPGGPGAPGGPGGPGGQPAPGMAPQPPAPPAPPAPGQGAGPRGGRGRGMGMWGPSVPEVDELRQALDNPETPAETIQAKLTALRDAKAKAEAELKQAADKLREVLTPRQEAQLVLMGMLE
jgi:hypothetical protein